MEEKRNVSAERVTSIVLQPIVLLGLAVAGIVGALAFPGAGGSSSTSLQYAALGVGSAVIAAGAIVGAAILRRGR